MPDPSGSLSFTVTAYDSDGNEVDVNAFQNNPESFLSNFNTEGDPVDTSSGSFYYQSEDVNISGRGIDLTIERFYRSRSAKIGSCGHNWSIPILDTVMTLWVNTNSDTRMFASVDWGDGRRTLYQQTSDTDYLLDGIAGSFGKIRRDTSALGEPLGCTTEDSNRGLVLREPSGMTYHFCSPMIAPGMSGAAFCYLRKVSDPYGNALIIGRNNEGRVTAITDTLGRELQLSYNADGFLVHIADWFGRTWDYEYDDRQNLHKVHKPAASYMDDTGTIHNGRPWEEYSYWEPDTDYFADPNRYTNHNLIGILRNDNDQATAVAVTYYTGELDFQWDRVKNHVVDQITTTYTYQEVFADPQTDRITHRTTIEHSNGDKEHFYHGEGLLWRKEIHDATGSGPASDWITSYDFNEDSLMLSMFTSDRTGYNAGIGRLTTYEYDSTNPDRFQQRNLLSIHQHADPSVVTNGSTILTTTFNYDPVTCRPRVIIDSLGRTSYRYFGHNELSESEGMQLPGVAGWDILSPGSDDPTFWGLGDLNGDNQLGGTFEPVLVEYPETVTASTVAGGSQTSRVPTEVLHYDALGRLVGGTDRSGVDFLRIYLGDYRVITKTDPSGINIVRVEEYDALSRLARSTTPTGKQSNFAYDSRDLVVGLQVVGNLDARGLCGHGDDDGPCDLAHGITTHYYYDRNGRIRGARRPRFNGAFYPTESVSREDLEDFVTYHPSGVPSIHRQYHHKLDGTLLASNHRVFLRDNRGRKRRIVDSSGVQIDYEYTARGDVREIRRTGAGVTRTATKEYDQYGQVIRTEHDHDSDGDGENDFRSYEYDGHGRLVVETSSTGDRIVSEYDDGGRVLHTTHQKHGATVAETSWEYDSLDRIISENRSVYILNQDGTTSPSPTPTYTTRWGYGAGTDQLHWEEVEDGTHSRYRRYVYDSAMRRVEVWHGASGTEYGTTWVLDKEGDVIQETRQYDDEGRTGLSPSAATWIYQRDQYGLVARKTDPQDRTTYYSHNALGLVKNVVAPNGGRHSITYDSLGNRRKLREKGADGIDRSTLWEYDDQGRLAVMTDPKGNATSYEYDELGRLEKRILPGGDEYRFEYDYYDRVFREFRPGGIVINRQYSEEGYLEGVQASGVGVASVAQGFEYDLMGNLARGLDTVAGGSTVELLRQWDTKGRLLQEATSIGGGSPIGFVLQYELESSPAEIEYPSGLQVLNDYDGFGRLETIQAVGISEPLAEYSDHYGSLRPRSAQLAGNLEREIEYTSRGRVESEVLKRGTLAIAGASYSYDALGNVKDRTRVEDGILEVFGYDSLDRLRTWDRDLGSGSTRERSANWDFDDNNNITSYQDSHGPTYTGVHNDRNQLTAAPPIATTVAYLPDGEQENVAGPTPESWHWDALGRPVFANQGSSTVHWTYDVLGRTVLEEGVTTRRFGHIGSKLSYVSEDQAEWELLYGFGGELLFQVQVGGDASYLMADATSNVLAAADATSVESYEYSPYGIPYHQGTNTIATSPIAKALFLGAHRTKEIGTYRLGARVLDPEIGRFISRDPVGESAGFNLYAYGAGNPLRYIDPLGTTETPAQPTHDPMTPAGGETDSHNPDIINAGSMAEALDEVIRRYGDWLDLDPDTGYDDLSIVDKAKVIDLAKGWTLDLLDIQSEFGDAGKHMGAPGSDRVAELKLGLAALENEMLGLGLSAVFDLPEHAIRFTLETVGFDADTAATVGEIGGLAADVLSGKALLKTAGGFVVGAMKRANQTRRVATHSSRRLGRALEDAGQRRPPNSTAHHIVAGGAGRAEESRGVLRSFDIGIDDAANGVFLPSSYHSGIHTNEYYDAVNDILSSATTQSEAQQMLADIAESLTNRSFP